MNMTGTNGKEPRVGVVIPAYHEAGRIGPVVEAVRRHCPDVFVVDDGSSDATAEEARRAGATVLQHAQNQGKGAALSTGFQTVRERGFDAVITLDADGQHDPAMIPAFIEAYARTGLPVLVGNRMADVAHMPRPRKWTNRFMSYLLSRMMGQYVPDTQCGYRLYRCDVIPLISAQSGRFAAESEVLLHVAKRGLRIGAVRISTIYGDEQSKINPMADSLRFIAMLWRHRKLRSS